MKYFAFILIVNFVFIPKNVLCQKKKFKITEDSMINKWVHATINIAAYYSFENEGKRLSDLIRTKKITPEQANHSIDSIRKNESYSIGTAIFLEDNNKHYLISARHVFEDPTSIDTAQMCMSLVLVQNITSEDNITGIKGTEDSLFIGKIAGTESLSFFSEPYNSKSPYIFSQTDVGILFLEGTFEGRRFAERLIKLGYQPINTKDIDSSWTEKPFDKIIAIGFPEETELANRPVPFFLRHSMSHTGQLPMVTKGQISGKQSSSDTFYADIFVYHGNSGGPIVHDNKLIGIVHGPDIKKNNMNSFLLPSYLSWQALLIKSSVILPLLRKLESKTDWSLIRPDE